MDEQRQNDQLEPTYNSSVVALKTNRKRWTIKKGGERGSGRSALMARHDDDDDEIFFLKIIQLKFLILFKLIFL